MNTTGYKRTTTNTTRLYWLKHILELMFYRLSPPQANELKNVIMDLAQEAGQPELAAELAAHWEILEQDGGL